MILYHCNRLSTIVYKKQLNRHVQQQQETGIAWMVERIENGLLREN